MLFGLKNVQIDFLPYDCNKSSHSSVLLKLIPPRIMFCICSCDVAFYMLFDVGFEERLATFHGEQINVYIFRN